MLKSRSEYSGLSGRIDRPPQLPEYEEDSDEELMVHECLRRLPKTRSEYAFPQGYQPIRPPKTTFELNLSKMLSSMEKSVAKETEPAVADFAVTGPIDSIWPAPDRPIRSNKPKSPSPPPPPSIPIRCPLDSRTSSDGEAEPEGVRRASTAWSSPPNIYTEEEFRGDSIDSESAYCWSAPEFLVEDASQSDSEEETLHRPRVLFGRKPERVFADSYPRIHTTEPSTTSIRLPSDSSSCSSPSPPRPRSPVLGAPASPFCAEQTTPLSSRPLPRHAPPTTQLSTDSDEHDDDDLVWPERTEDRVAWQEGIPRSHSLHHWQRRPFPTTRSYHALSQLTSPGHAPAGPAHPYSPSPAHSHVSELDEGERRELASRQHWVESASRMRLDDDARMDETEEFHADENKENPYDIPRTFVGDIRRSATSDGLRRVGRRQLPRRPMGGEDEEDGVIGDLPSSISMYERSLREYRQPYANGYPRDYGSRKYVDSSFYSSEYDVGVRSRAEREWLCGSRGITPVTPGHAAATHERWGGGVDRGHSPGHPIDRQAHSPMVDRHDTTIHSPHTQPLSTPVRERDRFPPPSELSLQPQPVYSTPQTHKHKTVDPAVLREFPNYHDIQTPMTPSKGLAVLSPSVSGRRLPALPVRASAILGAIPPVPPPKEHRLCFGMDQSMFASSVLEESYTEDNLNGNPYTLGGAPVRRNKYYSANDSSGVSSCAGSDSITPTHRVQSAFVPRHKDEVLLDVGDPVRVDRHCEDHWSYGVNLRTGQSGIFPASVVCEIDLIEEISMGALCNAATPAKPLVDNRDTFYLTMLASVEVAHHKGNDVLLQAMNKVLNMYQNKEEILVPQTVLMEISFRGIHVIDKKKKNFFQCPTFDYFYSLQNISFCGAHPKQLRYFGFISKHPLLPRFACHVFLSNDTTQPIVESIGRAFKRSYDEYMAFAHPTEDIYLE